MNGSQESQSSMSVPNAIAHTGTKSAKERQEAAREKYRQSHRDEIREAHRKWVIDNPEKVKECRRRYKELHPDNQIRYREKHKVMLALKSRLRSLDNPEKRKANLAVGNALRAGKLHKEPCAICGKIKSQAHHEDYYKPLDVVWLCGRHHMELHLNRKNSGG